jgi:hypothetical protein
VRPIPVVEFLWWLWCVGGGDYRNVLCRGQVSTRLLWYLVVSRAVALPRPHRGIFASHQTFWWRWRDVTAYAHSDATDAMRHIPGQAPTARMFTGRLAASQVVAVTLRGVVCGAVRTYLDSLIRDGRVA